MTPSELKNKYGLPEEAGKALQKEQVLEIESAYGEIFLGGAHRLKPVQIRFLYEGFGYPDTNNPNKKEDPNAVYFEKDELGYKYISQALSLAYFEDYGDDAFVWVPEINCFGSYDAEHEVLHVFPNVDWKTITNNLDKYLGAQWNPTTGETPMVGDAYKLWKYFSFVPTATTVFGDPFKEAEKNFNAGEYKKTIEQCNKMLSDNEGKLISDDENITLAGFKKRIYRLQSASYFFKGSLDEAVKIIQLVKKVREKGLSDSDYYLDNSLETLLSLSFIKHHREEKKLEIFKKYALELIRRENRSSLRLIKELIEGLYSKKLLRLLEEVTAIKKDSLIKEEAIQIIQSNLRKNDEVKAKMKKLQFYEQEKNGEAFIEELGTIDSKKYFKYSKEIIRLTSNSLVYLYKEGKKDKLRELVLIFIDKVKKEMIFPYGGESGIGTFQYFYANALSLIKENNEENKFFFKEINDAFLHYVLYKSEYVGKYSSAQFFKERKSFVTEINLAFNLACIYSLFGNKKEALYFLEEALKLKLELKYVEKDAHLNFLRNDEDFKALLEKYKQN